MYQRPNAMGAPGRTANAPGLPNAGSFGEMPGAVPAGASQNGSSSGGPLVALADGPNTGRPKKAKSTTLADSYAKQKKRAVYAS
jgi:hypothetical protein